MQNGAGAGSVSTPGAIGEIFEVSPAPEGHADARPSNFRCRSRDIHRTSEVGVKTRRASLNRNDDRS